MRIISGTLGGRMIRPPAKMPYTRPTTDVAKTGLFNILNHQFNLEGIHTLDLFGGTGSISYELASRGAAELTIVEKDPAMAAFIQQTAKQLGVPLQLVKMDVFKFMSQANASYDFIFAGPPYALITIDQIPILVFQHGLLKKGGWFVLEHTPRNQYKNHPYFLAERHYGTTVFSIFSQTDSNEEKTDT